jgi:hypothetical protein
MDETSVRANYQVIKHLPGPYGIAENDLTKGVRSLM